MRQRTTALLVGSLMAVSTAQADLLVNPGFEEYHDDGAGPKPTGWVYWDNVFSVDDAPPAHGGDRVLKMFGNWGWPWNVAGVMQEFPAAEGDIFEMHAYARHSSGDALTGTQNYAVMKIEFFDAGGVSVGSGEGLLVDGNSTPDLWLDPMPIQATAPAGTASVQALLLFLQPDFESGAALIDDASFRLVPAPASVALFGLAVLGISRRRR